MLHLVNINEHIVSETLAEILKKHEGICTCERCRYDMTALALNKLKPNYVVSAEGAVFSRVALLEAQNVADVVRSVTDSISTVSKNPRHLVKL